MSGPNFRQSAQYPASGNATATNGGAASLNGSDVRVAGDIGYAIITWGSSAIPTMSAIPSGWIEVVAPQLFGTSLGVAIYKKVYAAGDAAFTFTASGAAQFYRSAVIWSNGALTRAVDGTEVTAIRTVNATNTTSTATTASAAGAPVMDIFLERSSTVTGTTVSLSAGTSDYFIEDTTASANGSTISVSERTAATTTVGTVTATYTNSTSSLSAMALTVVFLGPLAGSDSATQSDALTTLTISEDGADATLVESLASVAVTTGGSDTAVQADSGVAATAAGIGATDSATHSEVVVVPATITATDVVSLDESASVNAGGLLSASDDSTLTEGAVSLPATLTASDSAIQVDAAGSIAEDRFLAVVDSTTLVEPPAELAQDKIFGSGDSFALSGENVDDASADLDAEDLALLDEVASIVRGFDNCPISAIVSVDDVRRWLGLSVESMSDDDLAHVICAEGALQGKACRIAAYDENFPGPLRQSMLRRVGRVLAARGVPLGLVGAESEAGASRIPAFDVEIERMEGPYRKWVFA